MPDKSWAIENWNVDCIYEWSKFVSAEMLIVFLVVEIRVSRGNNTLIVHWTHKTDMLWLLTMSWCNLGYWHGADDMTWIWTFDIDSGSAAIHTLE